MNPDRILILTLGKCFGHDMDIDIDYKALLKVYLMLSGREVITVEERKENPGLLSRSKRAVGLVDCTTLRLTVSGLTACIEWTEEAFCRIRKGEIGYLRPILEVEDGIVTGISSLYVQRGLY